MSASADVPLRPKWRSGQVKFAISNSLFSPGTNFKANSDIAGAIQRSFDAWIDVADIQLVYENSTKLSASPSDKGDRINLITISPTYENLSLFSNDERTAAKTRVFYDRRGSVTKADIVLDPTGQFSTDGTFGTFDLQTVLTHEIGHALGLRHTNVIGSLMNANVERNGASGSVRSDLIGLSDEDISAIRSRYGAPIGVDCCGSIFGKAIGAISASKQTTVWAEDEMGRTIASTLIESDRTYRLNGLLPGTYRVFWTDSLLNGSGTVKQIGEAVVENDRSTVLNFKAEVGRQGVSVKYIGSNGLLGTSPVILSPGDSTEILIAGKNITEASKIEISGEPGIRMTASPIAVDYADGVDVVKTSVFIGTFSTPGNYDIFVRNSDGSADVLLGAIIVKKSANP